MLNKASMLNVSSIQGLEVVKKFRVVDGGMWRGVPLTTKSYLHLSCTELDLWLG